MGVRTSRSAQPIVDDPRGAAMGTWGLWLTILVLAMFVAGMAAAALYLETGQPRQPVTGEPPAGWPPGTIAVPGGGRALLAAGALLVAAVAATLGLRWLRSGPATLTTPLVTVSGGALLAACLILISDLRAAPSRWDEHAYTSVYWVLTSAALTFTGVGVLMIGAVLVHLLTGVVDIERHLELTNTTIYLWFVLAAGIVLLSLVHLLPAVGGGS